MPAVNRKIIIEQGVTFNQRYYRRSPSKRPIDMTGFSARFAVRDKVGGTLLFEATTALNGGITIDGARGRIDVVIPDEITSNLNFTKGWYNLTVEDVSGDIKRLAEGNVTFSLSV